MRKLLFVFMIAAGFAQAEAQSMLRVHVADNTPINVAVDGRYFNKRGTGVTVGDLPPGRHFVQIYAANQDRRGRLFQDVIYEGKVKTVDGMISLMVYDPASGDVDLQQQEINAYTSTHPRVSSQMHGEEGNNNNGGNYDNNNGVQGNPDVSPVSPDKLATLTDSKIDMLKTQVAAKNTDTDKMKTLKDGLANETVTSEQVGTMMDWFGFESSKVDFAEWAYNNTVDKEYFSDLENKFTYKEYQDALDNFIKSKG